MTGRDARRHHIPVGAGVSAASIFTGRQQVSFFVVALLCHDCWYYIHFIGWISFSHECRRRCFRHTGRHRAVTIVNDYPLGKLKEQQLLRLTTLKPISPA
jgi:hypothetical protein